MKKILILILLTIPLFVKAQVLKDSNNQLFNKKWLLLSLDTVNFTKMDSLIVEFVSFNNYKSGDLHPRLKRYYKKRYFGYIKIYQNKSNQRKTGFFCNISAYFLFKENRIIYIQWKPNDWIQENFTGNYRNTIYNFLNSESTCKFDKNYLFFYIVKQDEKDISFQVKLKLLE